MYKSRTMITREPFFNCCVTQRKLIINWCGLQFGIGQCTALVLLLIATACFRVELALAQPQTIAPARDNLQAVGGAGVIYSIQFTSDYEFEAGVSNILSDYDVDFHFNHGANWGRYYRNPEWIPAGGTPETRNGALMQKKNTKLAVKVKVKVPQAGKQFTLQGDGPEDYLDFSKTDLATGGEQFVEIEANEALPNEVRKIVESIEWKITVLDVNPPDPDPVVAQVQSGPHKIFVVWDEPKVLNSANRHNSVSLKRIEAVMAWIDAAAITDPTVRSDQDKIAKTVQLKILAEGILTMKLENGELVPFRNCNVVQNNVPFNLPEGWKIWGLLDKGPYGGQCQEQATLMEQALRILGIDAIFKLVVASSTIPIQTFVALDQANIFSLEPRIHTHNGQETWERLLMWFPGTNPEWNLGEGCTLVNGKLYPAWLGDLTGEALGNRTAEHHVLQLLEAKWTPDNAQNPQNYIQQWARPDGSWCPTHRVQAVPSVP